jgi:predicted  nucleic acid-binding Zn-ribbon protein
VPDPAVNVSADVSQAVPAMQKTEAEVAPSEMDWKAEAEKWKAFSRKNEDAAKANAAAAAKLKEFEDRDLSELQKLQRDRDELSQKLTPLQQENARLHVALDKGLPKALAGRLQGSTVEELTADAEALMALVTQPVAPVVPQPRPDQSQGPQPSSVNTDDALWEQYKPHVLNNIRK